MSAIVYGTFGHLVMPRSVARSPLFSTHASIVGVSVSITAKLLCLVCDDRFSLCKRCQKRRQLSVGGLLNEFFALHRIKFLFRNKRGDTPVFTFEYSFIAKTLQHRVGGDLFPAKASSLYFTGSAVRKGSCCQIISANLASIAPM